MCGAHAAWVRGGGEYLSLSLSLYRTVGVSSADAAEGGQEETPVWVRAPQLRSSSGDGRGCRSVAGIGAEMTNGLQFTG